MSLIARDVVKRYQTSAGLSTRWLACRSRWRLANVSRWSAKVGPARPPCSAVSIGSWSRTAGPFFVDDADVRQVDDRRVAPARRLCVAGRRAHAALDGAAQRGARAVADRTRLTRRRWPAEALDSSGSRIPATFVGIRRQLSGGQRQRVAMARALAAHRPCSCSTSRSARSTPSHGADLQENVLPVRKERPVTCVLVTHDLFEAQRARGPVLR